MAYIGVYTCTLEMPWVSSLKQKRSLVKPVAERLKARFPVSVARLEGLNAHGWETLGVTTIHAEAQWVEEILRKVSDFVATEGDYRVTNERLEVLALEDVLGD